ESISAPEINHSHQTILFFPDPVDKTPAYLDSLSARFNVLTFPYLDGDEHDSTTAYTHQAKHAARLLDSLGIDKIHLLGKGIGGSVAVHLAAQFPEKVRSVILVSANGIEELE